MMYRIVVFKIYNVMEKYMVSRLYNVIVYTDRAIAIIEKKLQFLRMDLQWERTMDMQIFFIVSLSCVH